MLFFVFSHSMTRENWAPMTTRSRETRAGPREFETYRYMNDCAPRRFHLSTFEDVAGQHLAGDRQHLTSTFRSMQKPHPAGSLQLYCLQVRRGRRRAAVARARAAPDVHGTQRTLSTTTGCLTVTSQLLYS